MILTICLNAIMATAVCWLAYKLWQWRNRLVQINADLKQATLKQASISPQTVGYFLMLKRAQVAQTRLAIVQIQARSQQLVEGIRLLRLLQTVLQYRRRRYSRSKSSNNDFRTPLKSSR